MKCVVSIYRQCPVGGGGVCVSKRLPRWLGALFVHIQIGNFLFGGGGGGSELLPGWFVHFVAHFNNVNKHMKKFGLKKSVPRCPFDRGGGMSFWQCSIYGNNNTFQKGTSLRLLELQEHLWCEKSSNIKVLYTRHPNLDFLGEMIVF